jgi:hypothetical protein
MQFELVSMIPLATLLVIFGFLYWEYKKSKRR